VLDVEIFQGKLLSRLMERHFFLEQHIEHSHQPGPVRAGFAVHQRRIFDRLEQVARRENRFAGRRIAGEDLKIDQRNAGLLAGFLLQQVIAFGALAPQVEDRPQAQFFRAYFMTLAGDGWFDRYMSGEIWWRFW
jgi:hypothetical protein